MSALPLARDDDARTLREVREYLREDVPADLKRRLNAMHKRMKKQWVTSGEAAKLLGVSSRNTVKNWLEGGYFPSSKKTEGGHWRFLRSEVLAVRQAMEAVKSGPLAVGALDLPEVEDDDDIERLY